MPLYFPLKFLIFSYFTIIFIKLYIILKCKIENGFRFINALLDVMLHFFNFVKQVSYHRFRRII